MLNYFLLLLLTIIIKVSTLTLLKTYQLCPQLLNVQIIELMNQNNLSWFCNNNIDRDEPIKIFNMLKNMTTQVPKNKTQLISTFIYNNDIELLLIGTTNSTLHVYQVHNNRIISTYHLIQNNVIIQGISSNFKNNMIGWVGNDGKLCILNLLTNKTNCVLAHAFNASAIHINKFDNNVITCGGDRLCKLWRIEKADDKIILVKTCMLSKITKVNQILASQKRIIATGPQGFESISTSLEEGLQITGGPTICALLVQQWNTLLAVSPQGVLSIIQLVNGYVTTKYNLNNKVQSCSFYNMSTLITGHLKGEVKIWQI